VLSCSGRVELIQFSVPVNYHPVCEYDTVNFMLDATLSERYDGLFHTFMLYCDRILAETDLLARFPFFSLHTPCITFQPFPYSRVNTVKLRKIRYAKNNYSFHYKTPLMSVFFIVKHILLFLQMLQFQRSNRLLPVLAAITL